jgi:hypothetical protein
MFSFRLVISYDQYYRYCVVVYQILIINKNFCWKSLKPACVADFLKCMRRRYTTAYTVYTVYIIYNTLRMSGTYQQQHYLQLCRRYSIAQRIPMIWPGFHWNLQPNIEYHSKRLLRWNTRLQSYVHVNISFQAK